MSSTYLCPACHRSQTLSVAPKYCSFCGVSFAVSETETDNHVVGSANEACYEVRTYTICDGWVNCWIIEDDEQQTFASIAEAQAAIDEDIEDRRDMQRDQGEPFDAEDEAHERSQLTIFDVNTGEPVEEPESSNDTHVGGINITALKNVHVEVPVFQLILMNGPDEGIWINGVTLIDYLRGSFHVHFVDNAATDAARAKTGWKHFNANSLIIAQRKGHIQALNQHFQLMQIEPLTSQTVHAPTTEPESES